MTERNHDYDPYVYDTEYYNSKLLVRTRGRTYQGIPLVFRDASVCNKVLYDHIEGVSEALVVDTDRDPNIYADFVNEAISRARNERGRIMRPRIPFAVYDTVTERMPGSTAELSQLYEGMGIKPGDKVRLSRPMREGCGECIHKAAVCAAMLEILKTGGFAPGRISIDSSLRLYRETNKPEGGHTWTRYEDPGGIWILDPAQHYVGRLEESVGSTGWDYFRPEDEPLRQAALRHELGRIGTGSTSVIRVSERSANR